MLLGGGGLFGEPYDGLWVGVLQGWACLRSISGLLGGKNPQTRKFGVGADGATDWPKRLPTLRRHRRDFFRFLGEQSQSGVTVRVNTSICT